MRRHLLLAVAALAAPVFATYGVPDPLAESHAFVYEDRFIDAYLALEPLLTDGECSDSQESALWLAERLCAHIAASDRLYMRYDLENPTDPARGTWGSGLETALQEWAFVSRLNGLGADFAWDNLGGGYAYGHGFARLLLSRY
ncbi:hypothetical protein HOI71_06845, partial [Candidatus Poribacteria bacterium]|nr:hypothetical protein [Candidatus Poribacteria bacterium]